MFKLKRQQWISLLLIFHTLHVVTCVLKRTLRLL